MDQVSTLQSEYDGILVAECAVMQGQCVAACCSECAVTQECCSALQFVQRDIDVVHCSVPLVRETSVAGLYVFFGLSQITHTRTHTHDLSLSLALSLSPSPTLSLSLSLPHIHTHTRTHRCVAVCCSVLQCVLFSKYMIRDKRIMYVLFHQTQEKN